MTRSSIIRRAFILLASLSLASCAMMGSSNTARLSGKLSGASEVPAAMTDGSGTVEATLNKETNLLKWKVVYSGLSGPAGAGHFHGPAAAGTNAGVALGFKGSVASPFEGEATLTPAQAADVMAGKWYVNLHTAKYPGGEIRAQVVPSM